MRAVWTQKVGHDEMDEFKRRYISYLSDLRPYEDPSEPYTDEEAWKAISDPGLSKMWIVCDGEKAGFAVFYHDAVLSPSMWYISQFCIFPEYRRRHIGTDAVQLLKGFMDRVFFLVLDRNPALEFWKKCFSDYREFTHPEIISQPYERYYCYKRI